MQLCGEKLQQYKNKKWIILLRVKEIGVENIDVEN